MVASMVVASMVAGAAPARYSRAVQGQAGARMARKKRRKIPLIGYGAISQTLFDGFPAKKPAIEAVGRLVRPGPPKATQKKVRRKVTFLRILEDHLKLHP